MQHVTYNTVVPATIIGNWGAKLDQRGHISYFTLRTCTTGKHTGSPVWSRVIARLVPADFIQALHGDSHHA